MIESLSSAGYGPLPSVRPAWKRAANDIRQMPVDGILILIPVGLSLLVIHFLFALLGVFVFPIVRLIPIEQPGFVRDFLPFIGFGIVVCLVGLFGHRVMGRKFIRFVDALFTKIPGIKIVYASAKPPVVL
jgi:uncharacterized membrane protein